MRFSKKCCRMRQMGTVFRICVSQVALYCYPPAALPPYGRTAFCERMTRPSAKGVRLSQNGIPR